MQFDKDKSIFEYKISPYKQAIPIVATILIVCSLAKLAETIGIFSPKIYFPYVVCFSFLLFFALGNCLMSFAAEDQNVYWRDSVLSYAGVAILGGFIAYLFSGLMIGEAASFKWMFVVFTFGYVVLLTIMRAMRKIVKYAERNDDHLRGEK